MQLSSHAALVLTNSTGRSMRHKLLSERFAVLASTFALRPPALAESYGTLDRHLSPHPVSGVSLVPLLLTVAVGWMLASEYYDLSQFSAQRAGGRASTLHPP